ncbi:hypothetical protein FDECE_14538 [Fusarium decemcellulare]|nr:hypothetical protein FDECE_14538 [Fusarium decemcellulare]
MMNPCAPSFIPSISLSDTGSDDDDDDVTHSPSSEEASQSVGDVRSPKPRSPKKLRRKKEPHQPSALDPDKYDSMFPSLPSANQPKDQEVLKAKPSKKKRSKKKAKRVSVHSQEDGDISKTSSSAADNQAVEESHSAQEAGGIAKALAPDTLKPTIYTPKKPALEFLKPTVYTPSTGSRTSQRRYKANRGESPRHSTTRVAPVRTSPRVRPRRLPTPHPDARLRTRTRTRRVPQATTPITMIGTPSSIPASAPLSPSPLCDQAMGSPNPGLPYPVSFAPSLMPYSFVPWGMAPIPIVWPPLSAESQMIPHPLNYGQPVPLWPQPREGSEQCPQPQQQTGSASQKISNGVSSQSTSRDETSRGRHGHCASNSTNIVQKPVSTAGSGTQIDEVQDQGKAKPSSPRVLKNSEAAEYWLTGGVLSKDRELFGAADKRLSSARSRDKAGSGRSTGFIPTRQVQNSLQSKASHPASVPLNAPTGPSSTRRVLQPVSSAAQSSPTLTGSELGAWSQSKRWTSTATKERQAFQKMMANLRYMGADQSPFVPQNPAELTAFKAGIAESQKRRLTEEVQRRVDRANARIADKSVIKQCQILGELLGGKQFTDKLSPFFAAINCFNKDLPSDRLMRADWPTLAEFKEDGDKRAGRQGRCLPLPRVNIIAHRFANKPAEAYNPDGTIRWEKKVVKVGSLYLCPVTRAEPSVTPPVELRLDEISLSLQLMLHDIDRIEADKDEINAKKEEG